jgi:hypothetical protein
MSQARRSKSEFLGLHDPYADEPGDKPGAPRPSAPVLDQDRKSELIRASASLIVIVVVMAVVATALF